jgi:hypothetical protein
MTRVLCLVALLGLATVARASEPAATAELPAALQAVGVANSDVVTEQQAHDVRGECVPPTLTQNMSFSVTNGKAVGTITLLEGVFGGFSYANGNKSESLNVSGMFGGSSGSIGSTGNGVAFEFAGKAVQQTLDFVGCFQQNFRQNFTLP